MMKVKLSLVIFVAILYGFDCQVYYQPVQVLIPINGTWPTANHSIFNNTNHNNNNYNRPTNYYPNNRTWYSNNTYNGTQDGHLLLGTIQPYDLLLYNQEFTKPKRWWTYREKIIEYPKDLPAGYSRHETISAIRIYNKFLDGHGAQAKLESGGIGRQYVKIRLASPFGKGLRYLVQIYGR